MKWTAETSFKSPRYTVLLWDFWSITIIILPEQVWMSKLSPLLPNYPSFHEALRYTILICFTSPILAVLVWLRRQRSGGIERWKRYISTIYRYIGTDIDILAGNNALEIPSTKTEHLYNQQGVPAHNPSLIKTQTPEVVLSPASTVISWINQNQSATSRVSTITRKSTEGKHIKKIHWNIIST